MTDSLKTRVGRVIAGGMHALLDKIEDLNPKAAMEQSIREAEGVIDEVRHELGIASANRHLAQQQHAKLNSSHEELRDQIAQALAGLREDLARAAVSRQIDIEAQIPVLETTLADLARQEQELQGFTAALLAKKRELQEALVEFCKSRGGTESAAQPVGQSNVEQRLGKVADAFDKIYQRQTGLDGTQRNGSLEQAARLSELEQLVRDQTRAERLAQIRGGQA